MANFGERSCDPNEDGLPRTFVKITNEFLNIQAYYTHIKFSPGFTVGDFNVESGDLIGYVRK